VPVRPDTEQELFALAALSPEALAAAATEAVGEPFTVEETVATPFPYNWGAITTAGLWRVDVAGRTAGGRSSYPFFVKLLRHTRFWPYLHLVPEGPVRERFMRMVPWRGELDMHRSGIRDVLPPGLRTPALHAVSRYDDDHVALWSEFVDVRPGEWSVDDFALTAYLLGRLAARRRIGDPVNDRLPDFCRVAPREGALRYYVESRILFGLSPLLRDGGVWRHPALASALAEVGDPALPADLVTLADRLPALLDLLEALPQTHAHGDASPQNLLIPVDAPDTRVVIDWGFGTPLPVGFDLGQLLVGLANDQACSIDRLPEIADAILPAYVDGLAIEGYVEDDDVVRTGFVGGVVARTGLAAVPFELLDQPSVEEHHDLFMTQLRLTRYLLDLATTLS
jgi:phosphotransferase family enzyme